jgi:hypothetical protein
MALGEGVEQVQRPADVIETDSFHALCCAVHRGSLWLSPVRAYLQSGGMALELILPSWLRRLASPKAPSRRTFDLLAGQRLELSVASREGIHICAGEVVLSRPPRWMGDTLVVPTTFRLREGDAWTSVDCERVTLVGNATSRIVLVGG